MASNRTVGEPSHGGSQKLHKVLAERGLGSRRQMEEWIQKGRVRVDGEIAHVGQRVIGGSRIEVDGKPVRDSSAQEYPRILVMNKRVGEIVSRNDPQGRPSIFSRLPALNHGRWISVGRLDINTSGLLLLTNNGQLAHRLMHPSSTIDREYAVRIIGELSNDRMDRLRQGFDIDGTIQRFSDIQYYGGSGLNHWYHVVLLEGRNNEVRRLFERIGTRVSRLKRVRFGPVVLPRAMPVGRSTEMGERDVRAVCSWLAIDVPDGWHNQDNKRDEKTFLIPFPGLSLS